MQEPLDTQIGARFSSTDLPVLYDTYLVPVLFQPWAERLAAMAALRPGEHVLDVATGPGTVARVAAQRVGPSGHVIGADISAPMLAVARRKPHAPDMAPIEYVECAAGALELPDAAFDVVLCQQGLQFFPDRAAALHEAWRVLRPGGRLAVAVWSTRSAARAYVVPGQVLRDLGGTASGIPLLSVDDLQSLLAGAGFASIEVELVVLPILFRGGVEDLLQSLKGSPMAAEYAALTGDGSEQFQQRVRDRLQPDLDPHGSLHTESEAWVARAVKAGPA